MTIAPRSDWPEEDPPDKQEQAFSRMRRYMHAERLPSRYLQDKRRLRYINEELVSREAVGDTLESPHPRHDNRFLSAGDDQQVLFHHFKEELNEAAISRLARTRPAESAKRLLSHGQVRVLLLFVMTAAILIACWPIAMLVGFNVITTVYFISAIFFRVYLLIHSRHDTIGGGDAPPHMEAETLPVITILLPLYHDGAALPSLAQAIDRLEYPAAKKDVKLLLEEDDPETIAEARRLGLDHRYELIITPALAPRTKPKACNYGLYLARGDLIVIYDAEDLPESDQLLKAAAMFAQADQNGDDKLACIQARLNYYNSDDNWLTRLFTLEYSLWFDWLLPALARLGAPIPLGGTSNFFRTRTLIHVGGWDPYNVTEDADLGLRLARLGFRVDVLDSTTFEEANCRLNNWIRQRSRWMKGYLQTWLVHMRRPNRMIAATGWGGFLAVQLFVAGNIFCSLINPVMWSLFAFWVMMDPDIVAKLFPQPILQLNLFALVVGNLFFVLMMVFAPIKRGWRKLSPYGFSAPVYWLLTSLAAYKALWQALTRPHYWEKTDHFISAAARRKRADALDEHFE